MTEPDTTVTTGTTSPEELKFPIAKTGGRIGSIEVKVDKLREEMDEVLAFVGKMKAAMAKQILDSAPVQERLQSLIMEQLDKPDSQG